jgi:hypothetical protein
LDKKKIMEFLEEHIPDDAENMGCHVQEELQPYELILDEGEEPKRTAPKLFVNITVRYESKGLFIN